VPHRLFLDFGIFILSTIFQTRKSHIFRMDGRKASEISGRTKLLAATSLSLGIVSMAVILLSSRFPIVYGVYIIVYMVAIGAVVGVTQQLNRDFQKIFPNSKKSDETLHGHDKDLYQILNRVRLSPLECLREGH
jgi:hypothetical protein